MKFLVANPPEFSQDAAAGIARRYFGLTGQISALYSERDQNFRIRGDGNGDWLLKMSNAEEPSDLIDAQVAALDQLARPAPELPLPKVRRTADGAGWTPILDQGEASHATFTISFLPGELKMLKK